MNTATPRSQILITIGFIAMLIGAIDPMEGSLAILPGSGLILLGTYLSHSERRLITYRLWVFLMIAIGVAALFGFSLVGGIGGTSELSMWWGLLVLPYPLAWSAGIWSPDSPRWVLWFGIAVGVWYLAILVMTLKFSAGMDEGSTAVFLLGIIGAMTITGCLYRLRMWHK